MVSPVGRMSLFNPARKQTEPQRICTLEAIVECLREIGAPEAVCNRLCRYLVTLVDRMLVQTHLLPVKGTYGTLSVSLNSGVTAIGKLQICHLWLIMRYLEMPDVAAFQTAAKAFQRALVEFGRLPVPSEILYYV